MRGVLARPIVASQRPAHPGPSHEPMDTLNLRYRHAPTRLQPHWLLLLAALASLAMLVLACMLADPGSVPLR